MTLAKALRILKELRGSSSPYFIQDDHDALKLGIEALKWINSNRDGNWHRCNILLPGETEE